MTAFDVFNGGGRARAAGINQLAVAAVDDFQQPLFAHFDRRSRPADQWKVSAAVRRAGSDPLLGFYQQAAGCAVQGLSTT